MNRKLLLQLLPGFIPLFVFIIADEIWGTKIGLAIAVALGIIELIYYRVRDHKFDFFILLDTGLIVIMGTISFIFNKDVFFKIKPGIIGILMCVILGISAYTPANFMLLMSQRYLNGIQLNEEQYKKFRQNLRVMFWLFALYTILVFYSVWYMSSEAWAFISGGLFYILFGLYFGYEMLKAWLQKKRLFKEEWLPLVNEKGECIGKAPRSICHSDKKYLHPVVHLHVINDREEFYLQKRPLNKLIQPGKWDTAVGGHISSDENIEIALQREAQEEIGIQGFEARLVSRYIWESDVEREYVFCFTTKFNGPFKPDKHELADAKFWSRTEIQASLGKGIFTPNFEKEYGFLHKGVSY